MTEHGAPWLIGMDVGGTNLRVGVVHQNCVVWEQRVQADFAAFCRERPPAEALEFIIDTIAGAIQEARARYTHVSAVGIGFPGFIDPVFNVVSQSPNLPGLRDIDLANPLAKVLGLPVVVENDALAAAYGEYISGAHPENTIYIGLGTGVGGGAVLNGRTFPGSHGVAMEVGHIIIEPGGRLCGCGNRGCLEQYASASGVSLSYAELSGLEGIDSAVIAASAREGAPHALAAYQRAGDALAQGLATILKVLDVSRVIVGGGVSLSWPLMKPAFDARLDADLIPALRGEKVEIFLSESGDQAGIVGAAMLAHALQVKRSA